MKVEFNHLQAAHCENGVTTSLLRHNGVEKNNRAPCIRNRLRFILYLCPVYEN